MNPSNKPNPEMLQLAREAQGITQTELAAQLGVPQSKISKFEAGLLEPTAEELTRLSHLLKRRPAFFYWSDRVYGYASHELFHRMRQRISTRLVTKIHAEMNLRQMQLERLLRSVTIDGDGFRSIDPDVFNGDVAAVARAIRADWNLPPGPIPSVVRAIENAGGIILSYDFGTNKIDAASQWLPHLPPVFFLNTRFPADRTRLSLAHELGHIIMHRTLSLQAEQEATLFAAEFLMPSAEIKYQLQNATLQTLASLKPYWKVSMAALAMRARELGAITDRQHRRIFQQIGQLGYKTREPIEIPPEKPRLFQEILTVHQRELEYTLHDLEALLAEDLSSVVPTDKPRLTVVS